MVFITLAAFISILLWVSVLKKSSSFSLFLKEDHIKPVITLVIHFGAEEWDGPLSLHEMMPIRDMEILSYVENYRIHLIDPAKLTEEELNKFSTSMREVMGYIKYSNNKEKLLDFLRTDTHKSIEMSATRLTEDSFLMPEIAQKWYADHDMHTMYIAEIIDILAR